MDATVPSRGHRAGSDPLERIVVLVPHVPSNDPRVVWTTRLLAEYGRTEVIALDCFEGPPQIAYDGMLSIDCRPIAGFLSEPSRYGRFLREAVATWDVSREFRARPLHRDAPATGAPCPEHRWTRFRRRSRFHVGGVCHALDHIHNLRTNLIAPLRRRAETVFVPPRLVVCNDVWTLEAGIFLKQRYGCKLLYDSHEYHPHAFLESHPWEQWYWRHYEKRLCRHVDALITVNAQLADLHARVYGLHGRTYGVPNAAPLQPLAQGAHQRPLGTPIHFLLQGGASPGRGFETLLDAWGQVNDPRAQLWLRCPDSSYVTELRQKYEGLTRAGVLAFLPPVRSDRLVEAAAEADVGIIPYPVRVGEYRVNYNHLYCCPNKLSEYMQAGLAVLSTNSEFVAGSLEKYACGWTYDPERPETLVAAVHEIVRQPHLLQRKKENAYQAARTDYHWDQQARVYRQVVEKLTGLCTSAPKPRTMTRAA